MARQTKSETTLEIRRKSGERLRVIRDIWRLSQDEVAAVAKVTQPQWSKIEGGKRPFECEEAIEVAKFLGVTLDFIFRGLVVPEVDDAIALNVALTRPDLVEKPKVSAAVARERVEASARK
jgi:transcriptional regulator with XRE-family HTH domain